jgi:hypothetical protein
MKTRYTLKNPILARKAAIKVTTGPSRIIAKNIVGYPMAFMLDRT